MHQFLSGVDRKHFQKVDARACNEPAIGRKKVLIDCSEPYFSTICSLLIKDSALPKEKGGCHSEGGFPLKLFSTFCNVHSALSFELEKIQIFDPGKLTFWKPQGKTWVMQIEAPGWCITAARIAAHPFASAPPCASLRCSNVVLHCYMNTFLHFYIYPTFYRHWYIFM